MTFGIYDDKAWQRLKATANAVASYTAHSTYVDNRVHMRDGTPGPLANVDHGSGSSAFPALASTGGARLIYTAYEPAKNRWHVLRAMAS